MNKNKGLKRLTALIVAILTFTIVAASAFADDRMPRVYDASGTLKENQVTELTTRLDSISTKYNVDVNLAIFQTMPDGYSDMEVLADQVYEQFNYGIGSNHDGLVLVLVLQSHKWQISTEGYGITAFTDAGIKYIGEQMTPYLKESNYYKAVTTYADLADDFISKAKAGKPVDKGNLPKKAFNFRFTAFLSVVIGLVLAGIVVFAMLSKLKSVHLQASADFYTKEGSLNLTANRDTFLFVNVSRTKREKQSSSGGSSTHTSSSGRTHGGGGGSW